jgi:hypothetical protein
MKVRWISGGWALAAILGIIAAGVPAAGAATISPSSHNFGDHAVGTTSAPQTFTITNGCEVPGAGGCLLPETTRLTPSATPFSDYSLANACPPELTGFGETCTFTVTFHPAAAGARSGVINTGSLLNADLLGTGVDGAKKCKKGKKSASAAKKGCKRKKKKK